MLLYLDWPDIVTTDIITIDNLLINSTSEQQFVCPAINNVLLVTNNDKVTAATSN